MPEGILDYLKYWGIRKMTKRLLNDEQDSYLRTIAVGKSVKECTEKINSYFGTTFKTSQIRSYKSNHNISSGKKPWEFVDHSKQRIMTDEQDAFIRDKARGVGNDELTSLFNFTFKTQYTVKQIKIYKTNHGISSGLNGYFKKDHRPWNKGTVGLTKANKTSFKKGAIPPNYRSIGSERIDMKDGYLYVKVSDAPSPGLSRFGWRLKHQLLWEQYNGPIPTGYNVIFADRNKRNFDIDNLILVSDAELLEMNRQGLIFEDPELTKTGASLAKLNRKIYEKNAKKC